VCGDVVPAFPRTRIGLGEQVVGLAEITHGREHRAEAAVLRVEVELVESPALHVVVTIRTGVSFTRSRPIGMRSQPGLRNARW
jgi:hypothetical protein